MYYITCNSLNIDAEDAGMFRRMFKEIYRLISFEIGRGVHTDERFPIGLWKYYLWSYFV